MAKIYIDGKAVTIGMPRGIFMATRTNEQLQKLVVSIMSGERKDVFLAVQVNSTDPETGLTTTEYLPINDWNKLRKIVEFNGYISIQYAQKAETGATQDPSQKVDFRALLA